MQSSKPLQLESKLNQQLENGFLQLRFSPSLENDFQEYTAQLIKRRVFYVGAFSLLVLALYALVDYLFLPEKIWQFTIFVRLAMLIPIVLTALVLINTSARRRSIVLATFSCYLCMGLGIITLIAGSQLEGFDLPYDGLYSVILFGFFLLGLPFRLIIASTWGLLAIYGLVEILVGHTEDLLPQLFFLGSMCTIGTLGSYLNEHTLRTGYIKHQLVKLKTQQAIADKEAKTRFLAAAGHDLRQPINAIGLISEALNYSAESEKSKNMTEKLNESVSMLNRLLDSLLDHSRIEMGDIQLHIETFNANEFLEAIVSGLSVQLSSANLTLKLQLKSDVNITTDYLLLERIIRNLIANVIRHAHATEVTIESQLNPQKNQLMISVMDNGIGIEEQHLSAIFDEYYQITPNRELGMGLGLNIVKQLAELLHVELTVTSKVGQGTCFQLLIPTDDTAEN